eukprot:6473223-Pyramimonas_sp.AAC.3
MERLHLNVRYRSAMYKQTSAVGRSKSKGPRRTFFSDRGDPKKTENVAHLGMSRGNITTRFSQFCQYTCIAF